MLDTLEVLKPRINARYSAWQRRVEQRREAIDRDRSRSSSRTRTSPSAFDPAIAGNTQTLEAAENSELAVKIAQRELSRRDAARRATRQAGISEQEERERRTAGLWDDWESALSRDGESRDEEEIRRNMEASRRRMDGTHDLVPDGARKKLTKFRPIVKPLTNGNNEYRYPSIPKSQPLLAERYDSSYTPGAPASVHIPPKPPKERFDDVALEPEAPSRPAKTAPEPPSPSMSTSKLAPTFTFRPSAYLENGNPLRTVFLPPSLRTEFLRHAGSNTRRNLETCGMLCGTLISNALFIQRVVIPEQESTSDTCDTVNESALFDYCASEDLMVLGWIHTHPTQTCFMSSRDLHTHSGYQIMMPESIAIVCAPSKSPA